MSNDHREFYRPEIRTLKYVKYEHIHEINLVTSLVLLYWTYLLPKISLQGLLEIPTEKRNPGDKVYYTDMS